MPRRQRQAETVPVRLARNTKSQPCRMLREVAHYYALGAKMLKYGVCAGCLSQAEQGRAAEELDTGICQELIELLRSARKPDASGVDPGSIRQRLLGDCNRRAGHRPRAQARIELCCKVRRGEREA